MSGPFIDFATGGGRWWCVVVIRSLPCVEVDPIARTSRNIIAEDVVTVYGPMSKAYAHARADKFNQMHTELADGTPVYRPVPNAPAFLRQETWDEHHAVARPMNDVPW
jgi:hypothetical protein